MTLFKKKYRVESTRLPDWDYSSPGFYFITTNIRDHTLSLGQVIDGVMRENQFGHIVRHCWNDLPSHYPNMACDAFVIMPDHIHFIIQLHKPGHENIDAGPLVSVDAGPRDVVDAGLRPASTHTNGPASTAKTKTKTTQDKPRVPVSEIIRALKSFSARRINELRKSTGQPVWQPNYYDRVIRDSFELTRIRQYIHDNPQNWQNGQ